MNSNQKHRSNLSREDIDRYRSSRDESLKHSIEKKALENDFDADALEGWSDPGSSMTSMKRLDKRFGSGKSGIYWLVGSLAVVMLGIILNLYSDQKNETEQTQQQVAEITIEKTDVVLPEKIEAMEELPLKEQIKVKTIIQDFTVQQEERTEQHASESPANVDDLPVRPIEEKKTETTLKRQTVFGKEIYLYELKLLDYRAYRSRPKITTKQMVLTGTPANIGETSANEEETQWKDVEVPYIDYLEKTIELFSKGQNKKALARFEVILDTYPDDLNANFYAGLCYYNLNEFSKAINVFAKCQDSNYSNFNEEAQWYLAKSHQAAGNDAQARELFKKIVNEGGYYSAQAEKILK